MVVRAKILIQKLWIRGLEWDSSLPKSELQEWLKLKEDLLSLQKISVKRWLKVGPSTATQEIHGFADASERAYSAVVYLRTTTDTGQASIVLLTGKIKVATLKRVSIARLELCAAHL